MATYNLYRDGQVHSGAHCIAVRAGSELNMDGMELIGTVEADIITQFNPAASNFQSNQADYIQTGREWPHHLAVVVS